MIFQESLESNTRRIVRRVINFNHDQRRAKLRSRGEWIVVTTNGVVNPHGEAVMGAGLARQAAQRFPELPRLLGQALRETGNLPYTRYSQHIITLPTNVHGRPHLYW